MFTSRDLSWLAAAVLIATGWCLHWSLWRAQYEGVHQSHVSLIQEHRLETEGRVLEMKSRAAGVADMQRRYEEEVQKNEEFKANFESHLQRAFDNVRRIHAEQMEGLARKKAQAEAAAAGRETGAP